VHTNNNASCNDGNACTQSDICQNASCVGSNPVVCSASDICHTDGVCDPNTGACSNPAKPDGSACNDGNQCDQNDSCQAGICVAGSVSKCTAQDQCHVAGTCDPNTGSCSNPTSPNGSTCDDNNACTQNDNCQDGACAGTTISCDDNNPCTDDSCDVLLGCVNKPNNSCALDHYLSYKFDYKSNNPINNDLITVQDSLRTYSFKIKEPVALLNPVQKNHNGAVSVIGHPDLHYVSYHLSGQSFRKSNIKASNQFGSLSLTLHSPDRLLAPALKTLNNTPIVGDIPVADHYLCYRLQNDNENSDSHDNDDDNWPVDKDSSDYKSSKDHKDRPLIQVSLLDEFNRPKLYDIKSPSRYCNPVIKTHGSKIYGANLNKADNHLTCYHLKASLKQANNSDINGVSTKDQFNQLKLKVEDEQEICLPTTQN
jgi:hypothetical protein